MKSVEKYSKGPLFLSLGILKKIPCLILRGYFFVSFGEHECFIIRISEYYTECIRILYWISIIDLSNEL